MLGWVNKLNAEDFVDSNNGFGYITDAPSQHFEDRSTGQVIDINKISEDKRYIIFGENEDILNDGDDAMYGLMKFIIPITPLATSIPFDRNIELHHHCCILLFMGIWPINNMGSYSNYSNKVLS